MKKKILSLAAALLLVSGAANAQYIMKVTDSDGAVLYKAHVDNIDRVQFTAVANIEDYVFDMSAVNCHIYGTDGWVYEYEDDGETKKDSTYYAASWSYASGDTYGTLTVDQYGFGGWKFFTDNDTSSPLDLSDYNYLVIELAQGSHYCEFKLYDEANYWTEPFSYQIQESTSDDVVVVLDLSNLLSVNTNHSRTDAINTSQLYIVGFWAYGGSDDTILIKKVYATNTYPSSSGTDEGGEDEDEAEN